jgi:hypothetical protein
VWSAPAQAELSALSAANPYLYLHEQAFTEMDAVVEDQDHDAGR